jgi:hypothetical protein
LAECGILLVTERAEQRRGVRQQIEIAFASLNRVYINRMLGRSQGKIKELWA